jgi:hypothetical protein
MSDNKCDNCKLSIDKENKYLCHSCKRTTSYKDGIICECCGIYVCQLCRLKYFNNLCDLEEIGYFPFNYNLCYGCTTLFRSDIEKIKKLKEQHKELIYKLRSKIYIYNKSDK